MNHQMISSLLYIEHFEDGTLRQIGRSETNNYIDKHSPSGFVSYAVKPMRKDGNRGKISGVAVVR